MCLTGFQLRSVLLCSSLQHSLQKSFDHFKHPQRWRLRMSDLRHKIERAKLRETVDRFLEPWMTSDLKPDLDIETLVVLAVARSWIGKLLKQQQGVGTSFRSFDLVCMNYGTFAVRSVLHPMTVQCSEKIQRRYAGGAGGLIKG